MAAASESSGVKSFRNSTSKSTQSMNRRLPLFDSSSNSLAAQRPARPLFMYDIAQMIFVSSLSNALGQRRIYVRQDIKNTFPPARSQLKSEGAEGLRKFFFRPAEGAGEGDGWRLVGFGGCVTSGSCVGSGAFCGCVGPSLARISCKRW